MKFSFNSKLLLFLYFGFFISCDNPSSSDTEGFSINMISITDGDSLISGAGILIRFSKAIDLNSFKAQSIEKSINIFYSDSVGLQTEVIDLEIYKIHSAENVTFDGIPLTFWYYPRNSEIALFEETTIPMPFGTGEGLVLNQSMEELTFKSKLSSTDGEILGKDYSMMIHSTSSNQQLRAVPNPILPVITYQGSQKPIVDFIHLQNECQIIIKNNYNDIVRSIDHNGDGVERWDLTGNDGIKIEPGIYQFEINGDSDILKGGILVFPTNQ